jgi:hypothetical protein
MPDAVFALLPILFLEPNSSISIVTRLDGRGVVLRFPPEAGDSFHHSVQTGIGAYAA